MDIRKDDTERAVNLLKFYKSKLNKSEEKSLKKAMDKLIETLEAPLFSALLDIQEFYEVSLSIAIPGNQPAPQNIIEEVLPEVKVQVQQESPKKTKIDKKKSRRRQKSEDEKSEEIITPQVKVKENSPETYERAAPNKKKNPDYTDSKYQQEYVEPESANNENDPWLYFELQLNKGRKGYGFAVAGGYNKPHYEGDNGIFVTKIIPEGAAEVDGQLRIDDVIVSVNDVNLEYVTHEIAVDTLKNAGQSMILIIRRLKDEFISNENANHEETDQNPSNAPYYPPEQDSYQEEPVENSNFQQFEISLTKRSSGGLGISIQGGYDPSNIEEDSYISISKLTPGGVADVDGRLQVGDLILHVDDQSLNGVTHEEAVNILKNTSKSVTLYIARFIPENEEIEPEPEPEEPVVEKTEKKKKKKHRRDREE